MAEDKKWLRCEGTEDGKHVPLPLSATQAEDVAFVVDYCCAHCAWTGHLHVKPEDIDWD